ncbi:MAG: protein-(glutamine-N5) methyltransferase, release factor-specific [Lutibacter sp.]|nr:MAG: protein-(glutamine-N5) methyltransferase, release factor-specific [Lutibacter sp.]
MTLFELKDNFKDTLKSIYPIEEIDSFFYLLIEFKLQLKRVDIALNPTQKIAPSDISFFSDALKNLKKEIPIQYIIGSTEFFGLPFYVNKHVLIPRPETEELVQLIIEQVKGEGRRVKEEKQRVKEGNLLTLDPKPLTILDIGTGSGCIAVSLAMNLKNAKIWALDISIDALRIAQKNADLNDVEVQFIESDILSCHSEQSEESSLKNLKFDIIVSNPPYVRMLEKQEINNNVLENEPHLALFVDDNNPLLFYNKIADFAKSNLTQAGKLYFEINQYLGKETVELLENKGFKNIELQKDIFGNDRMIQATF